MDCVTSSAFTQRNIESEPRYCCISRNCDLCSVQTEKVTDSKAAVCKELRSAVQDAHTALADLRSRNAEQAFSQALVLLETNTPKVIAPVICKLASLLHRVMLLDDLGAKTTCVFYVM